MNYPSNISRQQFELIRPDLETVRRSTTSVLGAFEPLTAALQLLPVKVRSK